VNAVTDAGTAGLLARAGGEAALFHGEINLKSVPPSADKGDVEKSLQRLRASLDASSRECLTAVRSILDAS
jgi:formiminotetrahydrofolate cyclodeaminase